MNPDAPHTDLAHPAWLVLLGVVFAAAGLMLRRRGSKSFWPFAALAAIVVANLLFTGNFGLLWAGDGRLYGALVDVARRGSRVMLLATGMTLVIATAGIDLSVGAVMAIAGAVSALVLTRTGLPVPAAVVAALAVAAVAGLWNGLLVAFLRLQPIVATLILLVAGRGIAQLLTEGQIITFERPGFEYLGTGALLGLPVPLWLVAAVVALTVLVTRKTVAGLYIEAVGGNESAARLSGLRPRLVKLLVYGFSGLCAGVAGVIYTADLKAADINNCGLYKELDAILAVVIGGTAFSGGRARVAGSILGALIMQTLTTTILMRGVQVEYTLVVKALAVIAVCLLQSEQFRRVVFARWLPRAGRARNGQAPSGA
ncbi:MAG: ABC transporter permease [bacterium]